MEFHFLDKIIIAGFVFVIVYIGIFHNSKVLATDTTFILTGRKLSITGFVATLVSTWYGAILAVGENTLLYGIQTWFIFSLPYYVFAFLYAFLVAPRVRKSKSISIPDNFRKVYGSRAGLISALILSFLASPAPYLLGMGYIIQFMFGLELGAAILISTVFSVVYVWNGGFSAVVKTDFVQFGLMFIGFFSLFYFLWFELENPVQMVKGLPESFTNPLGGNSFQYVLAWFFIASWTFIDPGFFQRCAAAKTPKAARSGILISILFWSVFDFLTITCALYAVGIVTTEKASLTFPLIALKVLPIGFFGLFMTGIIATVMSTIDSLSLLSAVSFGRDILWRIQGDNKGTNTIPYIRKGLIIISFLSLLVASLLPSIVEIFYAIGSVLIPGLILPFLNTLRKYPIQMNEMAAIRWISVPILISMSWYIASSIKGMAFMGIEPFYPGIFSSIYYFIFNRIRRKSGS